MSKTSALIYKLYGSNGPWGDPLPSLVKLFWHLQKRSGKPFAPRVELHVVFLYTYVRNNWAEYSWAQMVLTGEALSQMFLID